MVYFAAVKKKRGAKCWMAITAVLCLAFVTTCGDRIICFCSDDPDGCGELCHVCGEHSPEGLSAGEPCNHFSFIGIDFRIEDVSAPTVSAVMFCDSFCLYDATIQSPVMVPVPCANAPPGIRSDSALFRTRRVLLLS